MFGMPSPGDLEALSSGNIKLTDEDFEAWISVTKQAAELDGANPAQLLSELGYDYSRWTRVAMTIGQGYQAQALSKVRDELPELKRELAAAKTRLEGASDAQRQAMELQVKMLEQHIERIESSPPLTDVQKHNAAMMEKWLPRLREAEGD